MKYTPHFFDRLIYPLYDAYAPYQHVSLQLCAENLTTEATRELRIYAQVLFYEGR